MGGTGDGLWMVVTGVGEEWWRQNGSDGGEEGKGIDGNGFLCNVSMSFSPFLLFFSFSFLFSVSFPISSFLFK